MKAILCLALLCAFVALSTAENCRSEKDCQHVTCPENQYTLDCARGECTCTHTTATCSDQNDCTSADSNCRSTWHCVDGKCRCGFGFGGIGK